MRPSTYNGQFVGSRVNKVFVIVALVIQIQNRDKV